MIASDGTLVGVITVKAFLECLRNGNPNYINKNCSVLYEKEQDLLMREAEDLMTRFHITTAVPVLNQENRVLYEIVCEFQEKTDQEILQDYYDKFERYQRSKEYVSGEGSSSFMQCIM